MAAKPPHPSTSPLFFPSKNVSFFKIATFLLSKFMIVIQVSATGAFCLMFCIDYSACDMNTFGERFSGTVRYDVLLHDYSQNTSKDCQKTKNLLDGNNRVVVHSMLSAGGRGSLSFAVQSPTCYAVACSEEQVTAGALGKLGPILRFLDHVTVQLRIF